MLQLPNSRDAASVGQPGDFVVKLSLFVCTGGHPAATGLNVAGCGVWSTLRVVSKQRLQQLDLYSSQATPTPNPNPNP